MIFMDTFHVSFPSDPAMWGHVRLMLRRLLEMQMIPARDADLLTLGVDEAFTNVMRHAYQGRRDGQVDLTFSCRDKRQV